jgi:hypothetical protein
MSYMRQPEDFRPSRAEVIVTALIIFVALFCGLTL